MCTRSQKKRKGGFQARDTPQDSTANGSVDKAETSLQWQEYFSQFQDTTDALPRYIHFPVCLWIMDPHSRVPKKNTSHGSEVLPQDTTHLTQRPCYQRGSHCRDPAGNWTTRRPPDHRKETQNAVVESSLPFIRCGQNHLARHSERGKTTRQTEEEVGRQHQGMDRPGVRQVPEGSGEQGKIEKTGWKIIYGAPTTFAVKGQMMMMIGFGADELIGGDRLTGRRWVGTRVVVVVVVVCVCVWVGGGGWYYYALK